MSPCNFLRKLSASRIAELSAHLNAAKSRLLELIAEFDEGGGWAHQGCMSCAHWLSWKCGVSPVAAREQVRVARALESLPKTHEAFSRGEISYSKVRALSRVASVESEGVLPHDRRVRYRRTHGESRARGAPGALFAGAAKRELTCTRRATSRGSTTTRACSRSAPG